MAWKIYNSRNSQYFQRKFGVTFGFEIYNSRNSQYFQRQNMNIHHQLIYNSRNSQYFQRDRVTVKGVEIYNSRNSQYFQRARRFPGRLAIYNSRNSQYFQREVRVTGAIQSTTVEILSTSKGCDLVEREFRSTTVEILSTSKGDNRKGGGDDLQQQKFLVLPKARYVSPVPLIYNSRNSQYFQRYTINGKKTVSTTVEILSTSKGKQNVKSIKNLQQQKFLVLPKVMAQSPFMRNLQQQKFLVLPKAACVES